MRASKTSRSKRGPWKIYSIKYRATLDSHTFVRDKQNAWYWLRCGRQIALTVRVQGLQRARAICRLLNRGEAQVW